MNKRCDFNIVFITKLFVSSFNILSRPGIFLVLIEMKNRLTYLLLVSIIVLNSCVPYDQVVYLQEDEAGLYDMARQPPVYKVRKSDLLQIDLKSLDVNTSTQQFFMGEAGSGVAQGGTSSGLGNPQFFLTGYLVDKEGMIDLPIMGKLKVEGKTFDEIGEEIELAIKGQVKYSKVTVRLSNYRVNVIGEVANPGTQYIFESDYTLLQALANAGDLTDFANRKRVKLLRNVEGKTKSIWFDLTDPQTLSSDYFYLLPGDMIYVEPLKAKVSRSNAQTLSIGISVVSLVVTIVTLTTR